MPNLTDFVRLILGVGCAVTLATTGMTMYARGELGSGIPKAFSGIGHMMLLHDFLNSSTESWPKSFFRGQPKDLQRQQPLPVALSSPGNSVTKVVPHEDLQSQEPLPVPDSTAGDSLTNAWDTYLQVPKGLDVSKKTRKKGLLSWDTAKTETAPSDTLSAQPGISADVATVEPIDASEGSGQVTVTWMDLGVKVEGVLKHMRAVCLFEPTMVVLIPVMALLFCIVPLCMTAAVCRGKYSEAYADPASVAFSRSPAVLSDWAIMRAIDALDKRMETVNFGDCFTETPLVQQPGLSTDADLDSGTSLSQECGSTRSWDKEKNMKSWDKLRAELAPRSSAQNSAAMEMPTGEDQKEKLHPTRMRPGQVVSEIETGSAEQVVSEVNIDQFSLLDSPRERSFSMHDLDQYEDTYFPAGGPALCKKGDITFLEELKSELERRKAWGMTPPHHL